MYVDVTKMMTDNNTAKIMVFIWYHYDAATVLFNISQHGCELI